MRFSRCCCCLQRAESCSPGKPDAPPLLVGSCVLDGGRRPPYPLVHDGDSLRAVPAAAATRLGIVRGRECGDDRTQTLQFPPGLLLIFATVVTGLCFALAPALSALPARLLDRRHRGACSAGDCSGCLAAGCSASARRQVAVLPGDPHHAPLSAGWGWWSRFRGCGEWNCYGCSTL